MNNSKQIFNIFDINDDCYFNIQVKNQINNLINEIKNENFPKDTYINILSDEIEKIKNEIKELDNSNFLEILPFFYNKLINLKEISRAESEYGLKIKKIYDEYNGKKTITLKYIKNKYKELYSKDISIMTISRIMRFHLGIHYRKTIYKNPNLSTIKYILMAYCFIIGVTKSIELNLNLVYIDECGFFLENNNLKYWRKNGEEITGGAKNNNKGKINLILAINKNEIILGHYYKNETISSNEFLIFIKDLIETIGVEKVNKTIFFLDNASYHLSNEIKKYVKNNKLKFFFNVPYKSNFNTIELCFHLMKNQLYKEIHNKINDLAERIRILIDDKDINKNIRKIYLKTLETYREFYMTNFDKLKSNDIFEKNFLNKKRKRKKKI